MSWWRKAFGLCEHKWEVVKQANLIDGGVCIGTRFYMKCIHCGEMKRKDLS
jgi:hypothetical protein